MMSQLLKISAHAARIMHSSVCAASFLKCELLAEIIALWLWLQPATILKVAILSLLERRKNPKGTGLNLLLACWPRRHLRGVRGG